MSYFSPSLLAPSLLSACWLAPDHAEIEEYRCMGPLTELVKWRDGVEHDRLFRGVTPVPTALASDERAHVEAAVTALQAEASHCDGAWRMVLWSTTDTPAVRLREEAVRRLLHLPARAFPPEALGVAGAPVDAPSGAP